MARLYRYITLDEREKIARMYHSGARPTDIAAAIGFCTNTVYVELRRGRTGVLDKNQRPAYDPIVAQRAVQEGLRRRGHGRTT